jgi:putative transposase
MSDPKNDRRSIRLKNYDYSKPGYYFLTICSFQKKFIFGNIEEGRVLLGPVGNFIEKCWTDIPKHFTGTGLDHFVVMPNHFHGILVIDRFRTGEACLAPTRDSKQKIGLAHIVGSFKSAVSKMVKDMNGRRGDPVWQRNYYEHVIRDEGDLNNIREYITNNPLQWALDEENPDRSKGEACLAPTKATDRIT